jgi:restriction endonuclease S subunit
MTDTRLAEFLGGKGAIQVGPFGSQLHQHDYLRGGATGVPVVMPTNIINGRISGASEVSQEKADELEVHKLQVGDILVPRRGDFSKCAVVEPYAAGWLCGTGCIRIRGSEVPHFLCSALLSPQGQAWLVANAVGSTMLNLSGEVLARFPVPTVSVLEQRRIADLLSSADASVESLEVQLEAAQSVRRQLLINAVRSHEALSASNPVKFGDVAASQLGKMLNTGRQTGVGARPYLRAANITGWGKLDLSDLKSMDFDEAELDKFSAKTGDLLVTEGGDAGRCAVYSGEATLCFQNAIHRVRADTAKTSNEYLALVLEYLSFTRQLDRYCSTTTIKHLSSGSLKSIKLSLPPLAAQQEAVANIKVATVYAETISSRLREAKYLRSQLLHELLSGAHTIPESYDRFLAEVSA